MGNQIRLYSADSYSDLRATYGVMLSRGAYEALLTPFGMKDYVTNESRLEHGTRYSATQYNKRQERQVSFPVVLEGVDMDDYLLKYEAFLSLLASGMVYLMIPRLKRVYKLVYTKCGNFKFDGWNKSTFTVEFKEPDPTDRPPIS